MCARETETLTQQVALGTAPLDASPQRAARRSSLLCGHLVWDVCGDTLPPPRLLLTHILTYRVIGLISCSLPSCNLPIRPSDRAGFVSGNHQDLSWQLEQNLQRRGDESQVGSFLNVQPAGAGT